jgi:hypothetical protein
MTEQRLYTDATVTRREQYGRLQKERTNLLARSAFSKQVLYLSPEDPEPGTNCVDAVQSKGQSSAV